MPTRQSVVVVSVFFALVLALTFSFGGRSQAATPINTYFELRSCLDSWPPSEQIQCSSDDTAGAIVNTTGSFIIPSGAPNSSTVVSFTPPDATYHEDTLPIGAMIGAFRSRSTLGLMNAPCGPGKNTDVTYAFFNSTVDDSDVNLIHPTLPGVAGPLGTQEYFGTDTGNGIAPANGIPVHAERYPSYLRAMFDPDFNSLGDDGIYNTGDDVDGPLDPVTPMVRYGGYTEVAGMATLLEYVIFAPGDLASAFSDPHPYSDLTAAMGYSGIFVLNDPIAPDAPSSINDFCTVLSTTTLLLGTSRDNPCTDGSADPYTGPCFDANPDVYSGKINTASTTGLIPDDLWAGTPDTCDADSDESGCTRYRNPAANTGFNNTGTHRSPNFMLTQRDADNDGIENEFDTCPFDANLDGDPRVNAGADDDMIDSGCDPTPGVNTNLNNHDGDVGGVTGSPYQNAQDNCPLAANGTGLLPTDPNYNQKESELDQAWATAAPNGGPRSDGIGNACDSEGGGSDSVADGHFHTFLNLGLQSPNGYGAVSCIGATDSDGDGVCDTTEDLLGSYKHSTASTPESLSWDYAMPLTNRGSGADDDADGIPNHDEPGPADDDAAGTAGDQEEEPFQSCNDNIDNDTDGLKDNAEADCGGAGANPDTDLDGIKDAQETACGPAGIELDATKVPERLGNSVDDDGDTSVDNAHAPVAGFDCDGDGFKDDVEAGLTWPPPGTDLPDETQGAGQCDDTADDDGDTIANDGCPNAGDVGSGGGATSHQARCSNDATKNNENDDQWPADFNDDGTLNLQDVGSFVAPIRHYGQPVANHKRWDLNNSGSTINLQDVGGLGTLRPPMLYNTRAYGTSCPLDDAFPPQ